MRKNKHFWQALKPTAYECIECDNIFDSALHIVEDYPNKRIGVWYRDLAICPHCQRKQHVNVHVVKDEAKATK